MTKPLALIIEDDERLADLFAIILKREGFDVEIILDGQPALTRLAAVEPTIVVLDLHLPNVSGQDILHHIRGDERLVEIPVIAVTADLAAAEEVRNEADLVLTKPFKTSLLGKAFARILFQDNRYRQQMEPPRTVISTP